MPLAFQLILALALAFAVVFAITPGVIRLAGRLDFYDRPAAAGYKGHARPTPYLGGAAVMIGFVVATALLSGAPGKTLPLIGGVVVLWVVGTIDDRRPVSPAARIAVEAALAAGLWALGLGWELGLAGGLDLLVTVVWVLAVVNALNLFDNMDGQAATIAGVIAGAVAILGVLTSDQWLTVTGASLAGACLAFLRYNLASPARVFLGDGGSMPVGFALAAIVMIGAADAVPAGQALVMGLLLVGVPALDTALVIISRTRRGIPVLTGGRDHLTHRTARRLGTAAAVAFALGSAQALLAATALVASRRGSLALDIAVVVYIVLAGALIAVLDRPAAEPSADRPEGEQRSEVVSPEPALRRRPAWLGWRAGLILLLVGLVAASPWDGGYYAVSIWAPAGLVLVALLVALTIARPAGVTVPAVGALAGVFGLAAWALLSAIWSSSPHSAMIDGDRLLVYGLLLAVLLLLIRDTRTAALLLALSGGAVLVLVGAQYVRLGSANPADAFLGGRLNEPLGYINGLGTYLILGLWPAIAAAEQRRWPWLAGVGMGCASLIASLLLLSQSRGVALAVGVAGAALLMVVPGRLRRASAFVLLGAGVAVMLPVTNAVFRAGEVGGVGAAQTHPVVQRALLVGTVAAVVWWAAVAAVERLRRTDPASAMRARRGVSIALAVGAAAVVLVGVVSAGRIVDTVHRQYDAFVELRPQAGGEATSSRLLSGAGNRGDYWRIALRVWRDHPVVGVGAGGYLVPYFRQRGTTEDIRQPHSIQLQALSELGVVGALLLALFAGAVLLAAYRGAARARRSPLERYVLVAAAGMFVSWLVHASVDWIHLLPGVTALALCAAAALLRPPGPDVRLVAAPSDGVVGRLVLPACALVLLLVSGVLLGRLALAERYATRAQQELAARPQEALKDANRALRLDGDYVAAAYTRAAALARQGDAEAAEETLQRALRAEPQNFVTLALLGDLALRAGDRRLALQRYAEAQRLNPRDPELARLAAGAVPSR